MTDLRNDHKPVRHTGRRLAIRRHAQRRHFQFYSRLANSTFVQSLASSPIRWRAEHWVVGGVALLLVALVGIVLPTWANATRHDPAPLPRGADRPHHPDR